MFDILRKRIRSAMGTRVISFSDLERVELDSIDSITISERTAGSKSLPSSGSDNGQRDPTECISASFVKKKVTRIIRSIKRLSRAGGESESKISMLIFMDMLRDQEYPHVSMSALEQFIKICRMVPKAHYLHYYMFFLHYATYYHHIRSSTDIINNDMVEHHELQLHSMRLQSKYLQHIINESRADVSTRLIS
jgi:hypothetical protein